MARPIKSGLDYFPMDVGFFGDIKIRKLIKYQTGKSIGVYAVLLCEIYKNGYYLKWDDEFPFIISELTGFDESYINDVVNSCISIGLFSEKLFGEHKILTSKGIQIRYESICRTSKKKSVIREYNVINTEITTVNTEITTVNTRFSTQSKVKESKGKESENIIVPETNFLKNIIPIEKLEEHMLSQDQWIENFARINKLGSTYEQAIYKAKEFIKLFVEKLKADNEKGWDKNDCFRYCNNFTRIQLKNGTKGQQNASSGFARSGYDPNNGIGTGQEPLSSRKKPKIFQGNSK